MSTALCGDTSSSRRAASTPLMPGMLRSITTTSGSSSAARRTASSPLRASATTAMPAA